MKQAKICKITQLAYPKTCKITQSYHEKSVKYRVFRFISSIFVA